MREVPLRIAIVGAGPAGLMLALTLLVRREGRAVSPPLSLTILEREDDHAVRDRANPDRSYTIDVTGHGRWAVAQIGPSLLARFDRELIPFRGIRAHPLGNDLPHEEGAGRAAAATSAAASPRSSPHAALPRPTWSWSTAGAVRSNSSKPRPDGYA